MKSLSLSKLLGADTGIPSSTHNPNQFTHILTFGPSPHDKQATLVERIDPQTGFKTPIFSITTSNSKPQIQICRITGASHPGHGLGQAVPIGASSFHSLSSTVDISLQNQHFSMKKSQMSLSGGYGFTCPPMGKLKWSDPSGGLGLSSSMELSDANTGQTLARYGRDKSVSRLSGMTSGQKKMEVFVPCGDFFLDMAVLTALTAASMKSKENEEAAEVAEAVAGA